MPDKITLSINGTQIKTEEGKSILSVCKENDIHIPVMCHFPGLTDVGACRLCLCEVKGYNKLLPACTTLAAENMEIQTHTEKLKEYRRVIVEMFFSERNHMCSICVANTNCELQDMATQVGMHHVRFPFLNQECAVDASHPKYIIDHNRCIMCTRCVRVCSEVEGAHNWDVKNRGYNTRIISDFDQPWGDSETCTSCGKCLNVCPTGALWTKGSVQGKLDKYPEKITDLIEKRGIH
ncbi:MAG: bidirectional hydrogenase complex protein HoxU [Candidatus Omnitrophica bacterium]|nr:bidirectional hydrogenase complex protein HoxU [Candidatus Omnitrophota bacterium]MCB9721543.1 bidirectional hydrogenase complex protein HoxU [Candidatus Omnitrophota bacterium]